MTARSYSWLGAGALSLALLSGGALAQDDHVHTSEERGALYEDIVAKIMTREAFSPIKNERFGLSYPEAFEAAREDFVSAQTDEDLFYALIKLSNARNDRHLTVSEVEGGLIIDTPETVEKYGPYRGCRVLTEGIAAAPIRFSYEVQGDTPEEVYLAKDAVLFVSELAEELPDVAGARKVREGDVLVAVNGMPLSDYVAAVKPYHCHSTRLGYWKNIADGVNLRSRMLPPDLYEEDLELTLAHKEGGRSYTVTLPYLPPEDVSWESDEYEGYEGFTRVMHLQNFDVHTNDAGLPVLLIEWFDFEDELLADVDGLVAYARENGMLGYDIILDARPSGGGSRGAYAIQRLTPKPFKTTFGNLRISDMSRAFAKQAIADLESNKERMDGNAPELVGDPQWLLDWLKEDFQKAADAGLEYTNNVPFKNAHAPKWHSGVLQSAEEHFSGDMVCIFNPVGGSHLDQMAVIMKDNNLCTMIGMPAGGYSNTWEGEEVLTWDDGAPIAEFMWSIGHTISPNGEIVEGNPAEMDEYYPITRKNYEAYRDQLISRAMVILGKGE